MTANLNIHLNSCIKLEEIRIGRRLAIPHRISFCLTPKLIEQIEQIEDNRRLILSPRNLADLRCYVLLNSPLEATSSINRSRVKSLLSARSPVIFATDYTAVEGQPSKTLFRSAIDLEGKISQQIQQDLWQNPPLLDKISQVHYWLVSEILAQLPFKRKHQHSWLFWCCNLLMAGIVTQACQYYLFVSFWQLLLIFFSLLFIFQVTIKILGSKYLKPLLIYQLATASWSRSKLVRRINLSILNLII